MSIEESLTPPPERGHYRPIEPVPPDGDHMDGFNKAIQDLLRNWNRSGGQVSVQLTMQVNPGNVVEYVATTI
jgi:hypothetical protein